MLKPRPNRSASDLVAAACERLIRGMVGCFILGVVVVIVIGFAASYHFSPLRGGLPKTGPRVPIPRIDTATLVAGRAVYRSQECSSCHMLAVDGRDENSHGGSDDQNDNVVPDLTHEGQRNASIDWQITNLRDHHRLYPNSSMPDYDSLSPKELRELASYLATRR